MLNLSDMQVPPYFSASFVPCSLIFSKGISFEILSTGLNLLLMKDKLLLPDVDFSRSSFCYYRFGTWRLSSKLTDFTLISSSSTRSPSGSSSDLIGFIET